MKQRKQLQILAFCAALCALIVGLVFLNLRTRSDVDEVIDGNESIVKWTKDYFDEGTPDSSVELSPPEFAFGSDHVAYVLSFLKAQRLPPMEQVTRGYENALLDRLKIFYLVVLDIGLERGAYPESDVLQYYNDVLSESTFPIEFLMLFKEAERLSPIVQNLLLESQQQVHEKLLSANGQAELSKPPEVIELERSMESLYNAAGI